MTSNTPAWTALDSGALPLPTGAPGDAGCVAAILATDRAIEAGWAGACAVALSRAWAAAGHRVVLADANVLAPSLHHELGLSNHEGLSDILLWGASVRRVAQGVEDGGFYLVTAGTVVADGRSVLEAPRWASLCDGFRDAGVTLAVFVAEGASSSESALARAGEVVIVAGEDEDVSALTTRLSVPVTGIVGRPGREEPGEAAFVAANAMAPDAPATEDPEEVAVRDVDALVPDEPVTEEPEEIEEPEEGEILELGALAPDEPVAEEIEEPEEDEILELGALAPDEPVAEEIEEPEEDVILDMDALAPDEPATEEGEEPEAEAEEVVTGWGSLDVFQGGVPEADVGLAAADGEAPAAGDMAGSEDDADMVDPLSLVEPIPPFVAAAEDGPEDKEPGPSAPPRVPPLEEVLEGASAPTVRPAGRRRGLLVVLLLVLIGLVAAALLGYLQIPGIPPLLGASVGSATEGPVATAPAATAPVPEVPTLTTPLAAFDVAVGAYQDGAVAAARVASLRAAVPGIVVTSVPVEVNGTLFHRVVAGPATDSAGAAALAGRLAQATHASPVRWLIRPTPKAFLLGEMADREAAERRVQALWGLDVPAYLLAVDYSDRTIRYRVYAGAFADETEASSLSSLLKERGLDGATLSDRIGRLPE